MNRFFGKLAYLSALILACVLAGCGRSQEPARRGAVEASGSKGTIATDNYSGGKQAAQAMIEALNGRGKVAILDHPEVESVLLRTKGFEEVVVEENKKPQIDIQIVAKIPGGGVKDKSFKATEDLVQAHPGLGGDRISHHRAAGNDLPSNLSHMPINRHDHPFGN